MHNTSTEDLSSLTRCSFVLTRAGVFREVCLYFNGCAVIKFVYVGTVGSLSFTCDELAELSAILHY